MVVVGGPYGEMKGGDAVAGMLREEVVRIDTGGVVGVLCEYYRLVGTDSVVRVVVEGGINCKMERGKTVASVYREEAVGMVSTGVEEAVSEREDGIVADHGGQVVVEEWMDSESHGDDTVAAGV